MNYQISDVSLPDNLKKDYSSRHWPNDRISNLSRLNVFIGPNNSGKSWLLRELFAADLLNYVPNLTEASEINKKILNVQEFVKEQITNNEDRELFLEQLQKFRTPMFTEKSHQIDFEPGYKLLNHIKNEIRSASGFDFGAFRKNIIGLENRIKKFKKLTENEKFNTTFKKIYIPSLRGLRAPENDREFYRNRTIADYFKNVKRLNNTRKNLSDFEILTGLELYDEIKKHLLGDLNERQIISDYQNFLSKSFFKGKNVVLIPRINSDVLYVKIGNEQERPIYKLGDGIQQLIILTIPMFIHRDKQLIMFIEEPELYMHPGFQRLFIETVLDNQNSENRQIFVATHSSQFIDITIDEKSISVFKIKKKITDISDINKVLNPKFEIINTSNDDFSLLAELGIRNSSLMLANCTIWVEGITDRLYLRKYLEIFQSEKDQEFMEDLHYSFVEYGGANLAHWSFLDKNDENIFD